MVSAPLLQVMREASKDTATWNKWMSFLNKVTTALYHLNATYQHNFGELLAYKTHTAQLLFMGLVEFWGAKPWAQLFLRM